MIDAKIAATLNCGQRLYSLTKKNYRGQPLEIRVNGRVKFWKRDSSRFKIPVKYGLYEYGYITEEENYADFTTDEDEAKGYPHPLKKADDWNKYIDLAKKIDPNNPNKRPTHFKCSQCGEIKYVIDSEGCGTGYACNEDKSLICYNCCGENDKKEMLEKGKITLYISGPSQEGSLSPYYKISNWPGTLSFKAPGFHIFKNNWGYKCIDAWFKGPDGFIWYGRHTGKSHGLINVRRTKQK